MTKPRYRLYWSNPPGRWGVWLVSQSGTFKLVGFTKEPMVWPEFKAMEDLKSN